MVLVTGASGFVSPYIIKQLQENNYKVRGVVPNVDDEKKKEEKVKALQNLCPEATNKLDLVEVDSSKSDAWEE